MSQLFKKAAVFGDIHFGKKNNSRQFNIDCENFVKWFVKEAHNWGADTCIFLGDWHDNRRFLNVSTLNYSLSNLELLDNSFNQVYFLLGNHDLYYREKREINSIEFARNLKNTKIIYQPEVIGDCAFIPWLIGNEWKEIQKIKSRYMFGHFELPNFLMNAMSAMPDNGELKSDDLINNEYVFSGHFHKRQKQGNIWYIGSPFAHNYSDAWDDERGMMFLEWGKDPVFKSWSEQPKFITLKLSELLEIGPENILNEFTYARITTDIDVTYEEFQYLREGFIEQYGAREISFVSYQKIEGNVNQIDISDFKTVDQIVIEGLSSIENTDSLIDHALLIDLYNGLDVDGV